MQMFLRKEGAYLKLVKYIKPTGFKEMSEAYQMIFTDNDYPGYSVEDMLEIEDLGTVSLEILRKTKRNIKTCEKSYVKFEKKHRDILSGIISVSPILLSGRTAKFTERVAIKNPYSEMLSQLRAMMLDLLSLLEAIHKFKELNLSMKVFESRATEYKILLEKLKQGKRITLTTTSAIKLQSNVQKIYDSLISDQKSLEIILNLLHSIFYSYLPKIKAKHFTTFACGMKSFASTSISEYENLTAYVLQIEESLKL